ncbi:23S rRNA (adenine(2503)-C(2))-methyltransferase RlmN [Longirhabdus pacifica]|uniref:23S rRNA (adenine(2503)-C(2))-methyltransferase RlmN n=1 Tax=Longirhabdus pacifica TaxID=2305227 RepID=UPI0010088BAD|nr:23S rRNA (adenine(2503)-C(2))-methyltransferase RlmN [Longirhabdus pacifica]
MVPSIYDLTYEQLQSWVKDHGQPAFRANQIFEWLYKKRVTDFEMMTNLSKSFREQLAASFRFITLKEITHMRSKDGTVKFLFALHDEHAIETVLMKHDYGYSVCVTTQVGCRIGCTFCASTLGGLKRNLTTGEIVAQVMKAQILLDEGEERVSSVVVMGSGEPFENYEPTMDFMRILIHEKALHIGQRHITVSTSGIVPSMYKFADENTQINFAVSLHAPNNELRSKLMPVNRRFPFEEVMKACHYYVEKTGRRITFEYALIGGVNDKAEHAEQLAELLQGMLCHVNLIPVNYVPERDYVRTSREDVLHFDRILRNKRINSTIRREQGHDIAAACGQLRAKHTESSKR